MKTRTKTEFAVMGLQPDGTWRMLASKFSNAVYAQEHLGTYASGTKNLPDLYPAYVDYKIAKRTVTTTFTEWEDV